MILTVGSVSQHFLIRPAKLAGQLLGIVNLCNTTHIQAYYITVLIIILHTNYRKKRVPYFHIMHIYAKMYVNICVLVCVYARYTHIHIYACAI